MIKIFSGIYETPAGLFLSGFTFSAMVSGLEFTPASPAHTERRANQWAIAHK